MKRRNVVETTEPALVRLLPVDLFLQRTSDLRECIARRAYELFSESGFTHGHDLEDWLRAEAQFLAPAPVEVFESQDAITVKSKLPSFEAKDIEIHVEARVLMISGTQFEGLRKKIGPETVLKRVFRSLELPAAIDPERVRATFRDGELQVELPKVQSGQKSAAVKHAAA